MGSRKCCGTEVTKICLQIFQLLFLVSHKFQFLIKHFIDYWFYYVMCNVLSYILTNSFTGSYLFAERKYETSVTSVPQHPLDYFYFFRLYIFIGHWSSTYYIILLNFMNLLIISFRAFDVAQHSNLWFYWVVKQNI